MADKFSKISPSIDGPSDDGFMITPSDATEFSQPTRMLYVGGSGNVTVMMANKSNSNTILTYANWPSGLALPIRVKRVYANTTATNIVGNF